MATTHPDRPPVPPPTVCPARPKCPPAAGGPALLVVDDAAPVRAFLRAALAPLGFAVLEAADGQAALALYRRHRAAVRLVLLDVRLPGLDGPGTLAALRVLDPQVRCCFLSGVVYGDEEPALLRLGALRVFRKPTPVAEFLRAVCELARPPAPP